MWWSSLSAIWAIHLWISLIFDAEIVIWKPMRKRLLNASYVSLPMSFLHISRNMRVQSQSVGVTILFVDAKVWERQCHKPHWCWEICSFPVSLTHCFIFWIISSTWISEVWRYISHAWSDACHHRPQEWIFRVVFLITSSFVPWKCAEAFITPAMDYILSSIHFTCCIVQQVWRRFESKSFDLHVK